GTRAARDGVRPLRRLHGGVRRLRRLTRLGGRRTLLRLLRLLRFLAHRLRLRGRLGRSGRGGWRGRWRPRGGALVGERDREEGDQREDDGQATHAQRYTRQHGCRNRSPSFWASFWASRPNQWQWPVKGGEDFSPRTCCREAAGRAVGLAFGAHFACENTH